MKLRALRAHLRPVIVTLVVAVAVVGAAAVFLGRGSTNTTGGQTAHISAASIPLECPSTMRISGHADQPAVGAVDPRSVDEQAVSYAQATGFVQRFNLVSHAITDLTTDEQQVVFQDAQGRSVLAMVFEHGVGGWTWDTATGCGDAW